MSEFVSGQEYLDSVEPISDEDPGEIAVAELAPEEDIIDAEQAAPSGPPCQACGCPIEAGDKFCPACGTPLANASPLAVDSRDAEIVEAEQANRHFRCDTCGAEVMTQPEQRSIVCPFCDSTYVVEFARDMTTRQPPEFIIGFAFTPQQARERFRRWLAQNSWYRPGDLKQAQIEDKLKGVYLPFWSFNMLAQSRWSASIGEYWYKTETYTTTDSKGRTVTRTRRKRMTEWWPLSGRHHKFYGGYLVSAADGLPQQEAETIKPFQLPALKRYEPFYIAGWLCQEYKMEREEAVERCQEEFYRREQNNIARFLPGDTFRSLHVNTSFGQIHSDLILLPVYMLSYRYKDKVYRFLLNGQTGRCAGAKPMAWHRIGAVAAIVTALIVLIVIVLMLLGAFSG